MPEPGRSSTSTLACFVAALAALLLAGVALPFYAEDVLVRHHYNQWAIAFTHLVTLGWLTTVIMGALTQLVPVALNCRLHSERLARWVAPIHVIGVVGMVAGFWIWNLKVVLWSGSLVSVGLSLFIYNLARTIGKIERHDAVSVHVATALAWLVMTFLAGSYLMHDKLLNFSPFRVPSAIHAHAHLAFLGWFLMMIIGVSYRLFPMFLLSAIQSPRRIWLSYGLLNAGIVLVFAGILLDRGWLPSAGLLVAAGVGIWLWEVKAILKARKRPQIDSAIRQALIALAHLPVLVGMGLWQSACWNGADALQAQAQTGYGVLALMGFATLFMMGMLYKIIPFLVWYRIYPPWVGKRPVPVIQDLYSGLLQRWAMGIFVAGVWATAVSGSLGGTIPLGVVRISAGLMGLGIGLFVVNMWLPLSHLVMSHGCPLARLLFHWENCKTRMKNGLIQRTFSFVRIPRCLQRVGMVKRISSAALVKEVG